jgi:hypothetical protein
MSFLEDLGRQGRLDWKILMEIMVGVAHHELTKAEHDQGPKLLSQESEMQFLVQCIAKSNHLRHHFLLLLRT